MWSGAAVARIDSAADRVPVGRSVDVNGMRRQLQAHLRDHVMTDRVVRLNEKGKTVYDYICKVGTRVLTCVERVSARTGPDA